MQADEDSGTDSDPSSHALRPRTPYQFYLEYDFAFSTGPIALGLIDPYVDHVKGMEGEGEEGEESGEEGEPARIDALRGVGPHKRQKREYEHVSSCDCCGRFLSASFVARRRGKELCHQCYPSECSVCREPVLACDVKVWLRRGNARRHRLVFCEWWGCARWAPLHARDGEIPAAWPYLA